MMIASTISILREFVKQLILFSACHQNVVTIETEFETMIASIDLIHMYYSI